MLVLNKPGKLYIKQYNMKKATIGLFLLFAVNAGAIAQDYKKVRTNLILRKYEDAKAELEKVSADPKAANNAETYLLKAEIYGTIAGDETLSAKYPGADREAFTALKKYLEMEPSEEKLKADNYMGVNPIYSSLFNAGVQYYNKKNWDSAFSAFKEVAELGDIFTQRKWSTSPFDTTAYLYTGVTAQNAQKMDEAAKYYGKLAEHKVAGQDYESIYEFLTKYYLNEKKEAEFNKYLVIAKEVYPQNPLWGELEFAYMSDNASLDDITKKFEEGDAGKTLTAGNYLDYGDYFINNKVIRDMEVSKKNPYLRKAYYSFSKAAELEPENSIANFNTGVAAYSIFENIADSARQIRGTTADIKTKRAAADKVADAAADKSIEWLEKAYNQMDAKTDKSRVEQNSIKSAARLLTVLYEYKRERAKGNNALYDKYDAKFKNYETKF